MRAPQTPHRLYEANPSPKRRGEPSTEARLSERLSLWIARRPDTSALNNANSTVARVSSDARRTPRRLHGATYLLITWFLAASLASASESPQVYEAAIDGIALGVELASVDTPAPGGLTAGETVKLRLELRDTASGTPLSGAEPAAWMSRRRGSEAPECGERVARYLTGDLFSRADVDFNVYYILSLNHDATLSVVDPLFGFGGSRTLALVLLESPGVDWTLIDGIEGGRLFVSQPEAGKVASIEAGSWKLGRQINVAPGVSRLRPSHDGTLLWALDPRGLSAIDPETGELAARLKLSSRAKDFVLSEQLGEQHAYVLLDEAGAVEVIDLEGLQSVGIVETGKGPTSIDWTHLGEAVWISHLDGRLVAVDLDPVGKKPRIRHRLETDAPLEKLDFAPDGRLGFALSPSTNQLFILDAARGRIVKSGPMAGGPDQVVFSDHLAYVRDRHSEQVLMVPLETAGAEGEPIQAADFPGGRNPLGLPPGHHEVLAPSFDRAPGASAMVVANAADQAIYFYMEGMAAPMGHFTLKGRHPLAVKVVDRSLRPRGSGVYETFARLTEPGTYDLAVFLDAPRLIHCMSVTVAEKQGQIIARKPRFHLLENRVQFLDGGGVELWLEKSEAANPTDDLTPDSASASAAVILYVSRTAGGWHRRVHAERVPTAEASDSDAERGTTTHYRARIFPNQTGEYLVWAEHGNQGLVGESPIVRLRIPSKRAAIELAEDAP